MEWLPTPVFLPWESHGQRSLESLSPWDCIELDRTEQLTLSHIHLLTYCLRLLLLYKCRVSDLTMETTWLAKLNTYILSGLLWEKANILTSCASLCNYYLEVVMIPSSWYLPPIKMELDYCLSWYISCCLGYEYYYYISIIITQTAAKLHGLRATCSQLEV